MTPDQWRSRKAPTLSLRRKVPDDTRSTLTVHDGATSSEALKKHGRRNDLPQRPGTTRTVGPFSLTAARKKLQDDKHAATSRKSFQARARWWKALHAVLTGVTLPITPAKLADAAAVLKFGKCRSANQYLYTLKRLHVLAGHAWSDQLAMEMKECVRSCSRGLGPAAQAQPLRLTPSWRAMAPPPVALKAGGCCATTWRLVANARNRAGSLTQG